MGKVTAFLVFVAVVLGALKQRDRSNQRRGAERANRKSRKADTSAAKGLQDGVNQVYNALGGLDVDSDKVDNQTSDDNRWRGSRIRFRDKK